MYPKTLFLSIVIVSTAVWSGYAQNTLKSRADSRGYTDIAVRWEVETNYLDEPDRFRSILTLINRSDRKLEATRWSLYFNFMRKIVPESLPSHVEITRINGNFYELKPSAGFTPLSPDKKLEIPFEAGGRAIKKSDAPSGFYIVYEEGDIIPIPDVTTAPFLSERQTDRGTVDNVPVPTPESRYSTNAAVSTPAGDPVPIVPSPQQVIRNEGGFHLDETVRILHDEGLEREARFLAERLEELTGTMIHTARGRAEDGTIFLTTAGDVSAASPEAYRLDVSPNRIEITGAGPAGVFYGIQSLRSLIPLDAYRRTGNPVRIQSITAEDAPRFAFRGMHLDVSRNFRSAEAVKKLMDVMAFYKLNKFHFHLTDDEGWRLAIEQFPELTNVGGRRGHTLTEEEYMIPSYGSGPYPDPEMSAGSGWYDRETFIDLLQYARDRHIDVIPEIDLPGHARAAIVAMKARYQRYLARNDTARANRYRLHEPRDRSEYESVQGWDDNVINVCQPSTYAFLEEVTDEIIAMYKEAEAELTTIHFGGDEVPHGAWVESPACRRIIRRSEELNGVEDLSDYFFDRLRRMLEERGLIMGGWEEIALDETDEGTNPDPYFAGHVRPNVWANIWGSGAAEHAYRLANAGYDVVMSQASTFYFDLAYDKHPAEPGLYWAGFIETEDPFFFIPFDLYKNAERNLMGNPIPDDFYEDAATLTETGRNHILGLQGQLWGELLTEDRRMEYMAVPRLLGLAERAWAPQPQWATISDNREREEQKRASWNEFARRLGQYELPRLDYLFGGVHYRLPPPGAVIEEDMLKANSAFPGLAIRYTTDGTDPDANSHELTTPVSMKGVECIRIATFDTRGRSSRVVKMGKACPE